MTSPRAQKDILRLLESSVLGRRHVLMTYQITLRGVSSHGKMASVKWKDTISEDCEIEIVDLECDLDAVGNENNSVDYLGIEPYQFEPYIRII